VGKVDAVNGLTSVPSPSFQISRGKDMNNKSGSSCFDHNASSAGSSNFLQQHAKATAVASASNTTSSSAISLRISPALRHGCMGSRELV
jgi:hypothetical protein